jgi:hypothetical protein
MVNDSYQYSYSTRYGKGKILTNPREEDGSNNRIDQRKLIDDQRRKEKRGEGEDEGEGSRREKDRRRLKRGFDDENLMRDFDAGTRRRITMLSASRPDQSRPVQTNPIQSNPIQSNPSCSMLSPRPLPAFTIHVVIPVPVPIPVAVFVLFPSSFFLCVRVIFSLFIIIIVISV